MQTCFCRWSRIRRDIDQRCTLTPVCLIPDQLRQRSTYSKCQVTAWAEGMATVTLMQEKCRAATAEIKQQLNRWGVCHVKNAWGAFSSKCCAEHMEVVFHRSLVKSRVRKWQRNKKEFQSRSKCIRDSRDYNIVVITLIYTQPCLCSLLITIKLLECFT